MLPHLRDEQLITAIWDDNTETVSWLCREYRKVCEEEREEYLSNSPEYTD